MIQNILFISKFDLLKKCGTAQSITRCVDIKSSVGQKIFFIIAKTFAEILSPQIKNSQNGKTQQDVKPNFNGNLNELWKVIQTLNVQYLEKLPKCHV